VHDWAEVHRLYEREGCSKTAIGRRLAMSRNTVDRLLALKEPPRYERSSKGSLLDAFKPDIAEMLEADAEVPATVILERLQERGYRGRITILKDYLQTERPRYLAARSFQRTSYTPGELGQFDWWELPILIPVGKDRFRKPYGLVATLPHSAGHETVFTFSKTMGDFCPAFLGTLERFGGVPDAGVFDNDSSIVATGAGKKAVLHHEVAYPMP
jgi:transposase